MNGIVSVHICSHYACEPSNNNARVCSLIHKDSVITMSSTVPIVQPQPGHKPSRAPREAHVGPSDVSAKRQYLVLYNLVSLLLWAALILRAAATILFTTGRSLTLSGASKPFTTSVANIYPSSGDFAKWVQTVALAEVVHSLVGLVRAPVLTTAMQVASRFLLVWGIVHPFGQNMLTGTAGFESESTRRNQQAYLGMLIAWSVTECIRYSYFVFFLGSGKVPDLLSWLRYAGRNSLTGAC